MANVSSLSELSGYLWKKKPKSKGWDRRFFKIVANELQYFESGSPSKVKGTIPLINVTNFKPCSFTQNEVDGKLGLAAEQGLELSVPKRTYILLCEDKAEWQHWLNELPIHIQQARTVGPARVDRSPSQHSRISLPLPGLRRSSSAVSRGSLASKSSGDSGRQSSPSPQPRDPERMLQSALTTELERDPDMALPSDDDDDTNDNGDKPNFADIDAEEAPPQVSDDDNDNDDDNHNDAEEKEADQHVGQHHPHPPAIAVSDIEGDPASSASLDAGTSNANSLSNHPSQQQQRARAGSQQIKHAKPNGAKVQAASNGEHTSTNGHGETRAAASVATLKLGFGRGKVITCQRTFASGSELVAYLQQRLQAESRTDEDVDELEVQYIDAKGDVHRLKADANPHQLVAQGARLYVVFGARALMAFHFTSGQFVADIVPRTLKVTELFHLRTKQWKASTRLDAQMRPLFAKQPGLFWRSNNADNSGHIDVKFASGDSFVNYVIKQRRSGKTGKLVIKSTVLDAVKASVAASQPVAKPKRSLRLRDFLYKRGSGGMAGSSTWKQRWCVLGDGALQYYENVVVTTPKGVIMIEDMMAVNPLVENSKDARPYTFVITTTKKRDFVFSADSADTLESWMSTLSRLIRKADKVGHLYKRGDKVNNTWRHRWFVLKGSQLLYYENESSTIAKGEIDLSQAQQVEEIDETIILDDFCFKISCGTRDYILRADTELDMLDWISAVRMNMPKGSVMKCGFVEKKGERNTAWKRRYLELSSTQLAYFEDESTASFKGSIPLLRVHDVTNVAQERCFDVMALNRTYEFRAETEDERTDWVTAIRQCTEQLKQQHKEQVLSPTRQASRQPTGGDGDVQPGDASQMEMEDPADAQALQQQSSGHPESSRTSRRPSRPDYDLGEVELPEPIMDVTQSRSRWTELNEHAISEEEWQEQSEQQKAKHNAPQVKVSGSLSSVLSTPLGTLGEERRDNTPFDDHSDDDDDVDDDVALDSDLEGHDNDDNDGSTWAVPQGVRDRLLPTRDESEAEAMDVLSPSMLRVVIHSMDNQSRRNPRGLHDAQQFRLSDVMLEYSNGWRIAQGSAFHPLPEDLSAHHEELRLGDIRVLYFHATRQWCVLDPAISQPSTVAPSKPTQAAGTPKPQRPRAATMAPEAQEFLKLGYMKCIEQLDAAVKKVVRYVCGLDSSADEGLDDYAQKQAIMTRCDDMRDPEIGSIVRRDFCSSVVRLLLIGMYPSRYGGLVRLTVWDLIVSATPAPTPTSPPELRQAYRCVRDLQSNPNMNNDNHVRARSFICSSLTHHFLHVWLKSLFLNKRLLGRLYEPVAFFRLCTPALMEELLMTLDPLNLLPFRLHTSFEMQRLVAKQRTNSVQRQPPRARTATEARIQRSASMSHHVSGLDRRTSASLPVQDNAAMMLEPEEELVFVRAMFPNDVTEDDIELSFQVGDVMLVDQLNANANPEWCVCVLHGRRGLVPLKYVEMLDEMEAAAHQATMSSMA